METGSILIREKRKHLSKMSDRVSQMFWSVSAQGLKGRREFIEVYIDNRSIFVIIYINYNSDPTLAGSTYWRERLGTVDLLIKVAFLLKSKNLFNYQKKLI